MPTYIVKLEDKYLLWSTIVDAPTSYGMTLNELRAYYLDEYGAAGMRELPERLARVEQCGTSAVDGETPDQMMWLNRAGARETPLTRAQIIAHYINDPDGECPRGFEEPPDLPDDDPLGWTFERYMGQT